MIDGYVVHKLDLNDEWVCGSVAYKKMGRRVVVADEKMGWIGPVGCFVGYNNRVENRDSDV